MIAIGILLLALLLSRFGIIDLIAKGYGAMTLIFMLIFVLPLFAGPWLPAEQ